mmetsp:Transcript_13407/g.31564  ORF Transcript_13407/g.31564 Transcript_13407/m.31564 type:complete len:206 (+) Transcript_13407:624-1241(+)
MVGMIPTSASRTIPEPMTTTRRPRNPTLPAWQSTSFMAKCPKSTSRPPPKTWVAASPRRSCAAGVGIASTSTATGAARSRIAPTRIPETTPICAGPRMTTARSIPTPATGWRRTCTATESPGGPTMLSSTPWASGTASFTLACTTTCTNAGTSKRSPTTPTSPERNPCAVASRIWPPSPALIAKRPSGNPDTSSLPRKTCSTSST